VSVLDTSVHVAGGNKPFGKLTVEEVDAAGTATVAGLDEATIAGLAEPLWIVPPGGSLLPG
jgi:hypothetical protein